MLNIDNKISLLPIWRCVSRRLCLRNSNKQHLIPVKFYVNNVSSISNESARFQLNLLTQTIVTTA